ncbi:unnamed protein product [Fraxinus pennsylvanica]|uniref:phosphopantothenoylcysteine decarboxylase n=1 Tax=Fraxinus pennsylvanica TaxID=56036 RepID=A0AAD1Z222_9LAMI|nr:unnamed protein product [Fraxinus pennsylvanica]
MEFGDKERTKWFNFGRAALDKEPYSEIATSPLPLFWISIFPPTYRPPPPHTATTGEENTPQLLKVVAYSELASSKMKPFQVNDASRKPRILLAASGSVAAIKFANLCQSFSQWEVQAVATSASMRFVDLKSFPKNVPLFTDQDEWSAWTNIGHGVLHIELCRWADIMVIAPLSANTLGKIAGGLGDNLLTCIVRAWDYSKPLFVSPSMNTFMWNNPFTKRHLEAIDKLGICLIPPATKKIRPADYGKIKDISSEDYGNGVMGDTEHIFSTITFFFAAWKKSTGGNIQ